MEEQMKLYKIISSLFLSFFLFGFAPSVFASNESAPEGCSELNLTPDKIDCLDKCKDNYSTYCNLLLSRGEANTDSDEDSTSSETDSSNPFEDIKNYLTGDRQPAGDGGTPKVPTATETVREAVVEEVEKRVKSGAKEWLKKKLFGDPAKVKAYNTKLQTEFRTERSKCNVYLHTGHMIMCGQPVPLCKEPSVLQQLCRDNVPASRFATIQNQAQDKIASLAKTLTKKLDVKFNDIMKDMRNQGDVTCGQAWHSAQMTCQFPVQALGGKVTSALNVIGKATTVAQTVAGLAGKSLNDLCKAMTTLSGAGVTIAMLARTKCVFAMNRCQKYCNAEKYSQPGYCNKLHTEQTKCLQLHETARLQSCGPALVGGTPVPVHSACGLNHMNLEKYQCTVQHINKMKSECGLLQKNTMAMMGDIIQLISTVQSAKLCWDKSGGNMSPSIDPEVCREMGGEPYKDETTGEDRCRFRNPGEGEGVCPPYGMPLSCDQPCPEDGSVPAGCPQGVCENGQMVSCTNTCPGGSVPGGCEQGVCENGEMVSCTNTCPDGSVPEGCHTRQSCTSAADCGENQVCQNGQCTPVTIADGCQADPSVCADNEQCDPASGQCVPLVCADGSPNYPNCGCGNCPDGQLCNPDSGQCIPPEEGTPPGPGQDQSCTSTTDCGDDQVCQDGTCVPDDGGEQSCTSTADCGDGKICQNGTCVPDGGGESCTTNNDCGPDKICQSGRCFCDCQGSPISCSEQCGGVCLEESVSCPCQGSGECTPPQKCVPGADGQKICSNDDGIGVCPDGSRVVCDRNCFDGTRPANCRICNSDANCEENQICNRGICVTEDPVLTADGLGGGASIDDGLGLENDMAIINDGMGGGDGDALNDPNNPAGNPGRLPGEASSGKRKGVLARLGALIGIGKSGGGRRGGFRGSFGRRGANKGDASAKKDEDGQLKGKSGAGGYGGYGAGGGGAGRNPATGGLGFSTDQMKKLKNKEGLQRTAFPSGHGNIGSVHQDIFQAVTRRYQKIYKLK